MMQVADDQLPTKLSNMNQGRSVQSLQTPTTLPDDYEPRGRDICCGRGKRNWNHAGNVYFRQLIQSNVDRYREAPSKTDKTSVVLSIVDQIRQEGSYFLKQNESGKWYDIGDSQAREKVGHSLRDQVTAMKKGAKKQQEVPSPEPIPVAAVVTSNLPQLKVAATSTGSAGRNPVLSGLSALSNASSGLSNVRAPEMMYQASSYSQQMQPNVSGIITNSSGMNNPIMNNPSMVNNPNMNVPGLMNNPNMNPPPILSAHDDNPYGYESHTHYPNQQQQQQQQQMPQFPTPLPQGQLQHFSSEPIHHQSYRRPSITLSDHGNALEPDAFRTDDELQHKTSMQVLERFARRPSWRAMSIASANSVVAQDMNQVQNHIQFDDDDEQLLKDFALRVGATGSGSSPGDRRSGSNRLSHTTDSSTDRRLSAMSMASMGGSFTDLTHAFRSSIRRSSVAWMQDMQEQFLQYDAAHNFNDTPQGAPDNRRMSALDMLKTLEYVDSLDEPDSGQR